MAENVTIESLSIEIEQTSTEAAAELNKLASSLGKLQRRVDKLSLTAASAQFAALGNVASGLKDFADATESLSGIKISSSIGNQLGKIKTQVDNLLTIDPTTLGDFGKLMDGVATPLTQISNVHLTSGTFNQLARLPGIVEEFSAKDLSKFAAFAAEIEKISRAFSAMPDDLKKYITALEKAGKNTEKIGKQMNSSKKHANSFFDAITKGSKKAGTSINSFLKRLIAIDKIKGLLSGVHELWDLSGDYYETRNLAAVAMRTKEMYEEAEAYALAVQDSYGIDAAEFLKYQSTAMDITKSFGISTETAQKMSKALTQLTYDYASLYNISTESASEKMQQVLTGELEGIRRLGKDISAANLKVEAANLGISTSVDNMTQAEKGMLRVISVLKQSDSAMGDMARTLDSQQNQLRVLSAQWTLLKRAVGDLFLPILQKTLPYLIAATKVAREIVVAFTSLWGIKLPEIDWSDNQSEVEDFTSAVEDANDEVKKLYQLSFDQLNILGTPSSASSAGANLADIAKLEAELDRLTGEYDEKFSAAIGSASDEIAQSMRDWITHGETIEQWAKRINDKFVEFKGNLKQIIAIIGGAGLAYEIFQLAKYAGSLLGIGESVPKVTKSFKDKTKALGEQTEQTAAETAAVKALTPQYGSLLTKVGGVALGVGALTLAFKLLSGGASESSEETSESVGAMATSTAESLAKAGASATQLTEGLAELGAVSMDTAETSCRSIFNTVETYAEHMALAADEYGNEFYDSMTSVAHAIDSEYAKVFNNICGNYEELMTVLGGTEATGGYKATTASTVSGAERERARALERDLQSANDYSSGKTGSGVSMTADELMRKLKKDLVWDAVTRPVEEAISGITDFAKNAVPALEHVIKTTAELIMSAFGGAAFGGIGIPAFASGGIVENGFFYANSSELVGRFANGKTAVANNEQITNGIANAVYRAMVNAQRAKGGGATYLVLDGQVVGKVFGDAIDNERRRSGVNITVNNGR